MSPFIFLAACLGPVVKNMFLMKAAAGSDIIRLTEEENVFSHYDNYINITNMHRGQRSDFDAFTCPQKPGPLL